ncbi:YqkE family protein [Paenibacillus radicis (ex Xue et al. 2023)]|uniref:YqkE family protein n=1 Tax=Paenibacillus radicis (ex Xue et al. 2023) TaxID=2972489 RepID=A0ABT1YT27_9BACL|nr:YqkE family protein [Paenibacillus radicis (ex Xue et al. 2023)]MCR8635855.1 YqkE family protein [Paenibacillus radicis (ex Xue et al. 2023)]
MAKKRVQLTPKPASEDKPVTLKDLLNPEIVGKLKMQADEMKAAEEKRKEEIRNQAAEARKAEQKRLDNDFGHLLEKSGMDWKNYK